MSESTEYVRMLIELQNEIKELKKEMVKAKATGDTTEVTQLKAELKTLTDELAKLKKPEGDKIETETVVDKKAQEEKKEEKKSKSFIEWLNDILG